MGWRKCVTEEYVFKTRDRNAVILSDERSEESKDPYTATKLGLIAGHDLARAPATTELQREMKTASRALPNLRVNSIIEVLRLRRRKSCRICTESQTQNSTVMPAALATRELFLPPLLRRLIVAHEVFHALHIDLGEVHHLAPRLDHVHGVLQPEAHGP